MRALLQAVMIVAIPTVVWTQTPVPVGSAKLAAPATIAQLDMGKLKGEPTRLGWSPDGKQLFIYSGNGGWFIDAQSGASSRVDYLSGYGATAWLP